jgi:nucleotide-binding universal stress UspA family protein
MIPYKQILFPTDFSAAAAAALAHAKELANVFDAELHVLYVEDDPVLACRV